MMKQQTAVVEEMRCVLYRYCLSLTHSTWDAEDLVQETCLRALPVMNGAQSHPNPTAYLLRTAKNIAVDQSRRRMRGLQLMRTIQQNEAVLDRLYEQSQEMEYLLGLLIRHLSPLQRTVFLLKELFGYKNAEAATKLSTSEGAVKAALHRARAVLHKLKQEACDPLRGTSLVKMTQSEQSLVSAYAMAIQNNDSQALVVLANAEEQEFNGAQAFCQLDGMNQRHTFTTAGSSSISMLFAA